MSKRAQGGPSKGEGDCPLDGEEGLLHLNGGMFGGASATLQVQLDEVEAQAIAMEEKAIAVVALMEAMKKEAASHSIV